MKTGIGAEGELTVKKLARPVPTKQWRGKRTQTGMENSSGRVNPLWLTCLCGSEQGNHGGYRYEIFFFHALLSAKLPFGNMQEVRP